MFVIEPVLNIAKNAEGNKKPPTEKVESDRVTASKEEIERIKKAMEDDEQRLTSAKSEKEKQRLKTWIQTYKDRLKNEQAKLADLESAAASAPSKEASAPSKEPNENLIPENGDNECL